MRYGPMRVFLIESFMCIFSDPCIGYPYLKNNTAIPEKPITPDDADRISTCIRVLCGTHDEVLDVFKELCRSALQDMINEKQRESSNTEKVFDFLNFMCVFIYSSIHSRVKL